MTSSKNPCKAVKLDGSRCQAVVPPQSNYCIFHDPSKAAERREARASGGRANRMKTLGAATPDAKIRDCRDALALISDTINQVRKGEIDPRVANCVGFLANIAMRAFEQGEMEARIERLERLIKSRNPIPDLTLTGSLDATISKAQGLT
jgi:hypothetical protein